MAVRFAHSWAHEASCSQNPTSSSHWWSSYCSSVILQNWRQRCLFIDPLYYFHCASPSFWGGIYFVYLLSSPGWLSPQPCWMQRPLSRLRLVMASRLGQGCAALSGHIQQSSNQKKNKAEGEKSKQKIPRELQWGNITLHVIEAKITWVIALYTGNSCSEFVCSLPRNGGLRHTKAHCHFVPFQFVWHGLGKMKRQLKGTSISCHCCY